MSNPPPPTHSERATELLLQANTERRAIITHLREESTSTVSLETLATRLAPDSPGERDHARIRLHHIHLPKLAETPLLSYDTDTRTVEYHGHPEFEALLDTIQRDHPTSQGTAP